MIGRILPLFAVGLLAACGSSAGDTQGAGDTSTSTEPLIAADASGSTSEATDGDTTAAVTVDATDADSGSAVVAAPEALQFSAPLVGGDDIELTTLAGRPVLLWFWAPW